MAESFYVNKGRLLIITVVSVIILGGSIVGFSLWANYNSKYGMGEIVIRKDSDFVDRYGFSGSGTSSDPYLIEDLIIETKKKYAIYILDTTSYFVIENCTIRCQYDGIYIYHIESNTAKIDNCDIQGTTAYSNYLVSITVAPNTRITNNNIHHINSNPITKGINIAHSQGSYLNNNNCSDLEFGINIAHSDLALIEFNYVELCSIGIIIDSCADSIIRYNELFGNDIYGVKAYYNYNCIFHHNNFIGNGLGIPQESQAYDAVSNVWFDITTSEGNFWSDLIWDDSATYQIDGYGECIDPYPLESPVLI
jgi:parallel beta-helix repeat protein